jgi:uncharacterized membrane protein
VEKYGFVYRWYDKKHDRYYIGAHWGTEDDGYVCSSKWMMNAYRIRSQDFTREILEKVYTSKKDTFIIEGKYLALIKDKELGIKYYNLRNQVFEYWQYGDDKEKIKEIEDRRRKGISEKNKGRIVTEENKSKISETLKRYFKMNGAPEKSESTREKISKNSKRLQKENKIGMKGKKQSEKHAKFLAENNPMNKQKYRDLIKEKKKGIRWLQLGDSKKMAIPGTEKYVKLIDKGYQLNVKIIKT